MIAGGSYADAFGTAALPANTWSYLTETYDGVDAAPVRQRHPGRLDGTHGHDRDLHQPAADRWRQHLRPVLRRPDRRGPRLQRRAHRRPDPDRPGHAGGRQPPVRPGNADRDRGQRQRDRPRLGRLERRQRRHRLPGRALPGRRLQQLRPDRHPHRHQLQRHQRQRLHQLQLPRPRQRRAGQPRPLLERRHGVDRLDRHTGTAVLTFTRTAQFTAQGPGSGGATWSVDGVAGGNASVGTITAGGLYTPPSTVGTHTVTATSGAQTANATVYVTNDPGTFTYHNDNMRTGQNLNETVLTPSNVNSSTFGKRFSYPLDGLTFASPLYVQNVNIPGQGFHNVVIVATEHDSVYAFDADGRSSSPLWHVNFTNPAAGVTTVPAADTGETGDIPNEIGITGTPVIDPATGTIYVVAKTKEVSGGTTSYVQRLHALDLTTGAEKFGGPVVIQASVPGTGNGLVRGHPAVRLPAREPANGRPARERRRLLRRSRATATSSRTTAGCSATTRRPCNGCMVYCTTPNGDDGGVWMNGDGVATDSTGSLYFISGDGTMDANTGGSDYGDSFIRLSPSGTVQDYFSPSVQSTLDSRESRSRLRRRAPAPGPERSPSARDGQRGQERHRLPRRPRQHGRLQLQQRPDRPEPREHIPEQSRASREATSARPSTGTARSTSLLSQVPSRPSG